MSYQAKPNTGALFNNDRKEKDTHPDLKGDFNIDGVNYWISAWKKQGSKGEFISFSVEKKKAPELSKAVEEKPKHRQPAQSAPQPAPFPDDDIPW